MPNSQANNANTNQSEILLESGTNELEILVFGLGTGSYGVNVAKVREVILPVKVSSSPDQPKSVMGMFNLRNRVMPLVNLHDFLDIEPANTNPTTYKVIVTEFNGNEAAFQVESVEQIYRISWSNIRPLPEMQGGNRIAVTGITEINDRLVMMLDFESVFDHINATDSLHIDHVDNELGIDRGSYRIILAEDSSFIRKLIKDLLVCSGYTQVEAFNNGQEAWDALQMTAGNSETGFDLIVSDIEMPAMDGLALTRNIRGHTQLKDLPVILFSSLITEDTRHKGEQVGANDQIAKPQMSELVKMVDHWVTGGKDKLAA